MKNQTNSIVCVKKPVAIFIFGCIFMALILILVIYLLVIGLNAHDAKSDLGDVALLLIPFLVALIMIVDYVAWSVCIDKNSITVRSVFYCRRYTYSQLDKVVLRNLTSYRHYSLDLIFTDGKRVTVVENYRNYNKFKAQLSKKKSFVIK